MLKKTAAQGKAEAGQVKTKSPHPAKNGALRPGQRGNDLAQGKIRVKLFPIFEGKAALPVQGVAAIVNPQGPALRGKGKASLRRKGAGEEKTEKEP
jgi:hypothetical protein